MWLALGLVACSSAPPERDSQQTAPQPPEVPTVEVAPTTEPPPRVDCEALSLPTERWWTNGHGRSTDPGARAGDVVLSTTRGLFELAAGWSGCEVLLVLPDLPRQEDADLWAERADLEELLAALPPHAILVVGSRYGDAAWVERVDVWARELDDPRLWVADQPLVDEPGWLGPLMAEWGWGFGVDRQQQIRYVGSFADVDRYDAGIGWWRGRLSYAAYDVAHWEFEADRAARLRTDDAHVVEVFEGITVADPGWAGERTTRTVALPADLERFDTLELDLHLGCKGEGEFGLCPPWDYLVNLTLCTEAEAAAGDRCSIEFGRWISAYHREGRWVHDVSPLLPLLQGGEATFQFYSQQPYEVRLSLRFREQGVERPLVAIPLVSGGALDEAFVERAPITVDVPPGDGRVELVTVVSGHGQAGSLTCAEFCVLDQLFTVGEAEVALRYFKAGTSRGCEATVGEGTVPNQYGTWWFGRQGWCPGREVEVERHDLTGQVPRGATVEVDYDVLLAGEPFILGEARMDVSSWLVVYE